jgi:hypothetical protein
MSKLKIMNGTPMGNEHLCRSCSHGQYIVGYRESDVLVVCTNLYPATVVPFTVRECSEYWDRNRPSLSQMHKLALSFSDGRRRPTPGFKGVGFAPATVDECDDEDEDEEDEDEEEAARLRRSQLKLIR